jgi:hypothetical protein
MRLLARLGQRRHIRDLHVHPERPDLVVVAIDEDEVRARVEDLIDPRSARGASLAPRRDVVVARHLAVLLRAVVTADIEDGVERGIDLDRHALPPGDVELVDDLLRVGAPARACMLRVAVPRVARERAGAERKRRLAAPRR